MPRKSVFNPRPCTRCGKLVIDVRDAYTYATFPVNAESISHEGLVLTPRNDPRKNPFANRAVVFVPHLPECESAPHLMDPPESEEPVPIQVDGDPASLPPGGMAGEEEEQDF